jgi:LacI family transcriptional regulator
VPEAIAIMAFDDSDMFDLLQPPLSVVRQPVRQLGHCSAEMLFSLLKADRAAKASVTTTILPVELILRRSCGCLPEARKGQE